MARHKRRVWSPPPFLLVTGGDDPQVVDGEPFDSFCQAFVAADRPREGLPATRLSNGQWFVADFAGPDTVRLRVLDYDLMHRGFLDSWLAARFVGIGGWYDRADWTARAVRERLRLEPNASRRLQLAREADASAYVGD